MRSLLPLMIGVSACAPDGSPGVAPIPHQGAPLALGVSRLVPAQPFVLAVDGAAPGAVVAFVRGTPGNGPCPPSLGTACLGVVAPVLVGTAVADAAGHAELAGIVPGTAPFGARTGFQAVTSTGPSGSAVVTRHVLDPDTLCDPTGGGTWPAARAAEECAVVALVNAARATGWDCGTRGVFPPAPPLTPNDALMEASRVHSAWMAAGNPFGHPSPGGPLGDTLVERVESAGYTGWTRVNENVGQGQNDANRVVTRWLGSGSHCQHLLDPLAQDVGMGFVRQGGDEFWTFISASVR